MSLGIVVPLLALIVRVRVASFPLAFPLLLLLLLLLSKVELMFSDGLANGLSE